MVVQDRTRLTGQLILYSRQVEEMTLEQYIQSIQNYSIAVVGIGISNLPLIELLCRHHCDVTACDRRTREQLGAEAERLSEMGAKLILGEHYLDDLSQDLIFRTPGLMPFDSHLQAARQKGSVITSEMEVFFSLCPCRIIAVTGSDGKTTTTTLISELLKAAGCKVHLGGNIGKPLLCELPSISAEDVVVLELSSFQLHSMDCRPDTAVITNISPNHLDKHKDYQDYIDAKSSIFVHQRADDRLILMADDPLTPYYSSIAGSTISFFSDCREVSKGCVCKDGVLSYVDGKHSVPIMRADEIRIPGQHNIRNVLAAFEAVRGEVPLNICRQVAMTFPGVPHRLEEIRVLDGVTYINDSIASSPSRTIAGLHAVRTKPIILLGGYDKKIPFDHLGDEICQLSKAAVVCGATADSIYRAILSSENYNGLPVYLTRNLEQSVKLAHLIAESGDIVVLSPACASFDAFRNFEERGLFFRKLVMSL